LPDRFVHSSRIRDVFDSKLRAGRYKSFKEDALRSRFTRVAIRLARPKCPSGFDRRRTMSRESLPMAGAAASQAPQRNAGNLCES